MVGATAAFGTGADAGRDAAGADCAMLVAGWARAQNDKPAASDAAAIKPTGTHLLLRFTPISPPAGGFRRVHKLQPLT